MKQIIQDLKSGNTILEEVPAPLVRPGSVLIRTHRSLVSLGTERMLVEFGKASYLEKARRQPEKVKQVLDKIQSDGLKPTLETVFRKLGEPLPLGYCNAGEVIEVGKGITDIKIGDRVVSNGPHAEVVCVNRNLVAKIPDGVAYEDAVFTVVGSIGLQGIRLLNPTFGETVVVTGLGLIGLLAGQILLANGCRVIGLDFDSLKVELANRLGMEAHVVGGNINPVTLVEELTNGIGADGVIITASTKSNEVISQAAGMSRKKGRIVLVGVIGLDIDRNDFYKKELSFQVSCSYGPGRYDDNYEGKGLDYPLAYVRWTEQRNFDAFLSALYRKQVLTQLLITERVPLDDYNEIYGNMTGSHSIASIMVYDTSSEDTIKTKVQLKESQAIAGAGNVAVIGAGNFTSATMLPALKKAGTPIKYIVSSGGLSSTILAKKYDSAASSTNYEDVLKDSDVSAVMITTRHNMHADMTVQALHAGKQVFVEKPLALNNDELNRIIQAVEDTGNTVTVGFNRRFSPHTDKMRQLLGDNPGPMNVIATMNAGFIPADAWVQDMEVGGGRIIGEACHMIDLITYLIGSRIISVKAQAMGTEIAADADNVSILLHFENGSLGVVNYFANGNKSYSKERLEVYYQGKNLIMDNFRKTSGYGYKTGLLSKTLLSTSQDKGHNNQFRLFTDFVQKGGKPIIPFDEIVNVTKASFAAVESMLSGKTINI